MQCPIAFINIPEMQNTDLDFKAAQEIGKIYQSLTDRGALVGFFLESASKFVRAEEGYLFLAGRQQKLWLEGSSPASAKAAPDVESHASQVHRGGKPVISGETLCVPLFVRNDVMGVAVFCRKIQNIPFTQQEVELALGLSSQVASALKNIILYEENMRMERLAAVGQTMGMVLHEIKNIIQLAKLSYEFIKRGTDKNEEKYVTRGVSGMGRAMRDLEGFTFDMLNLTKEYQIEPQPFGFAGILKELKEDLEEKATDFKVTLEFKLPDDFPEVEGDPRSLYRALFNLIKNAIEASDIDKENCWVHVDVNTTGPDHYEIKVEDNGIGMKAEVKAKLFEAFFSTKGRGGTGLGLLILERTIKHHRGEIHVESELGKGSRFVLRLPKKLNLHSH